MSSSLHRPSILHTISLVLQVRLIKYIETQKSKGFGFIDFVSEEVAKRAVAELSGRVILGRTIKLDLEGPKHRPKNY